jgi:hypothetical protein
MRRPLCDCGYYPVKRIWDPASVKKKKRQAGRQSSHFPCKCVQQTCRNTPPSESFNCPSLPTLVASAQLQELSLSSQGRLWFPTTRQPAYFMLWVQPHHGRSNGNERLRVIALRAIIRRRSGTLRRPLCDCGYYPVKRIWDPASVKKEEAGRQAKLSFSSQVCTSK